MPNFFDPARPAWQRRLAILFAMMFCGGIWGTVPALAITAIEDGAHPYGLTWWQGIGAGSILLIYLIVRRKRIPLDLPHIKLYLFCGLFGTVMPTLALFYAAEHVSAGIMAMTMAMVPITAYLISLAIRIDRFEPVRTLGIALGLAGVAMLILPGAQTTITSPIWVLVAVLVPLGYAMENVFLAVRSPRGTDSTVLVCGMVLTGGLIMTPIMLATDTWYPITWPLSHAEMAVLAIFIVNIMSYILFLALIFAAGPVLASMSGYFTVLSGILWGMALHGESHGILFWAALATMLAGMAMVRERQVERTIEAS
ncbi:MAG: DMT family transporter [Alphaproteobacteria bacterium]|nr:DMT family transporter [Rhodospirillaceae bacterium]MDG2482294.1 DMT family transporter [Alphaproteobacteria bacterium]MBT6206178.1 DMT family transporter [Rhodospirillaceae bacterium]MBT6511273.1 DMT family transporter [Rhodospirillaceae bacterium]MBT7615124.1 DMT family transporter [Rhodospirillaceae bacterium]